jgi:hypothetical protein
VAAGSWTVKVLPRPSTLSATQGAVHGLDQPLGQGQAHAGALDVGLLDPGRAHHGKRDMRKHAKHKQVKQRPADPCSCGLLFPRRI